MERVNDPILFKCIHDFFVIYLPKQRNCSEHTIRSYRNGINSFLDYIKETKGIKLSQISFSMFNRDTLGSFLESLEASGNSTSTRNQRLNCIRSFCSYAAKVEPVAVNSYNSVLLVPIKKQKQKMLSICLYQQCRHFYQSRILLKKTVFGISSCSCCFMILVQGLTKF